MLQFSYCSRPADGCNILSDRGGMALLPQNVERDGLGMAPTRQQTNRTTCRGRAKMGKRRIRTTAAPPSGLSGLDVERRFAHVELQNLALDLDRADQDPNLLFAELIRVGAGQLLQFLCHGGVLVGGGL